MKKTSKGGFTLIEMLIVVAVISILASIAYPSYLRFTLNGRRAEGRKALTELLQQQERFMTQTNSYCTFSNTGGVAAALVGCTAVPFKTMSGENLAGSAYWLSAEACPVSPPGTGNMPVTDCVRVVATPIQADAEAGSLRMTSTSTKDCIGGTNPTVCWK